MGIWNKLQKSLLGNKPAVPADSVSADRASLSAEKLEDLQRVPASPKYQKLVHDRFYRNYPEKPFVSKDREKNTNWLEQAEIMPKQSIIPPERMKRFSDGLLPGHIYMLYWIGKNGADKRIPSYFEYKYGIEFEQERQFLISHGYLAENKPTIKGADAIVAHFEVIDQHSPEASSAQKAQQQFADSENITVEQDSTHTSFATSRSFEINGKNVMIVAVPDRDRVLEDIAIVNKLLSKARKELAIKETLKILDTHILFNDNFNDKLYTYLEYEPITASGKQSKYPFILHVTTKNHYESMPTYECFGSISYLQDNRIGSATLHYWYKNIGYHVSLGMANNSLSVKKIEQSVGGTKTTIYKK